MHSRRVKLFLQLSYCHRIESSLDKWDVLIKCSNSSHFDFLIFGRIFDIPTTLFFKAYFGRCVSSAICHTAWMQRKFVHKRAVERLANLGPTWDAFIGSFSCAPESLDKLKGTSVLWYVRPRLIWIEKAWSYRRLKKHWINPALISKVCRSLTPFPLPPIRRAFPWQPISTPVFSPAMDMGII